MLSAAPEPDNAALEAMLSPWAGESAILLAVSGGPDSMALMHLAARWRDGLPALERPRLIAATVDHGLRPESADEALMVAKAALALEISHHTLVWAGDKPGARIQEAAREARYRLLADCARLAGARVIMTAHHADDQAQTILFRLLRGSSPAGLAGIRPRRRHESLEIARPLLAVRKQRLITYCRDHATGFVDDPSNHDPKYARTRMTGLLAAIEAEGLDAAGWDRLARRAARMEAALQNVAQSLFARAFVAEGEGWRADLAAIAPVDDELLIRLLALALTGTSPGAPPVRLERLERLAEKLGKALADRQAFAATLGGRQLRLSARGQLTIRREAPRRVLRERATGN